MEEVENTEEVQIHVVSERRDFTGEEHGGLACGSAADHHFDRPILIFSLLKQFLNLPGLQLGDISYFITNQRNSRKTGLSKIQENVSNNDISMWFTYVKLLPKLLKLGFIFANESDVGSASEEALDETATQTGATPCDEHVLVGEHDWGACCPEDASPVL